MRGKIYTARWKNFKAWYYVLGFARLVMPKKIYQLQLQRVLNSITDFDKLYIERRVLYYNKLEANYRVGDGFISLNDFRYISQMKNYFFDTFQYSRYFSDDKYIAHAFGDVIHIPQVPAIVKSRPIADDNENSVVLKLDKVRHFVFLKDSKDFSEKVFKLLWRGNAWRHQKNRLKLLDTMYDHPLCDVGCVNDLDELVDKKGTKLNLYEHLNYQFILSLEGNDVATNLKWIMSSNSIAVMPKPKYETWFMEGTLIPDYHYILVKDDFSDLIEKITYYHNHSDEAEQIIRNANEYVAQFKNKKREKLISLLVLQKYFDLQK